MDFSDFLSRFTIASKNADTFVEANVDFILDRDTEFILTIII